VAKSRKVFLAIIVLAGGYALAMSFSSLAETLARWTGSAAREDLAGVLVPIGLEEPAAATKDSMASPVAENGRQPVEPARAPEYVEPPKWVAAAPEASPVPVPQEPAGRGALARVKDVTAWSPAASGGASPWDRWPAWQPSADLPRHVADSQTQQAAYQPSDNSSSFGTTAGLAGADDQFERRHIVVDGDSLARLADRYLDDPQLANEIFRLNREVLSDPELLPIGVELLIPDRRVATVHRPQVEAMSVEADQPTRPVPLIPPASLQSPTGMPRAQLLSPLPIGHGE